MSCRRNPAPLPSSFSSPASFPPPGAMYAPPPSGAASPGYTPGTPRYTGSGQAHAESGYTLVHVLIGTALGAAVSGGLVWYYGKRHAAA